MPKALISVCFLILIAVSKMVHGQVANFRALDKPFEWGPTPDLDDGIPDLNAVQGADILWEEQRVSFIRSKPEQLSIVFDKHMVIRYGTREAAREYGRFILPESFDPPTDYQDVPWEHRDSLPRPLYFETRLDHFAARVIGPVERRYELVPERTLVTQRKKTFDRYFRAYSYDLRLNGIAPGDTVEIRYKYTVPFEENWFRFNSSKHYFHGPLHKHRYQLQVDATLTQGFVLRGAPADSTALTKKKRKNYWFLKDLNACTKEVNARLHEDLPHIVYGTAVNSNLYQHGHVVSTSLGGIPYMYSNVPYWVTIVRMREEKAPVYRRLALKKFGVDVQTRKVQEWTSQFGGVEVHPVEKALRAHNRISSDFTFQWDDAWFDNTDMSLLKPGDLLYEKKLREIGRYNQYSKLLSTLRLRYETIYVHDKRAGRMSNRELTDLWENEFLFQLVDNRQRFYFHPKRRRSGYFVNEVPFYWEGTAGMAIDIDRLWSNNRKTPKLVAIRPSSAVENSRFTQVTARVGANGLVDLDVSILLNGQFSTMTRDTYLYGERDSTIMPMYGERYLGDLQMTLVDGPQQQAPFTMEVGLSGQRNVITALSDSIMELDLAGFFPFLAPSGFNAAERDLAFYWDFEQQDRFKVDLFFDEPVVVKEQAYRSGSEELGAEVHFDIKQESPEHVVITASLLVGKERVPVGQAEELGRLLNTAIGIDRTILSVVIP